MDPGDERHFVERADGLLLPTPSVTHRDDEYDSAGFDVLRDMQARHFWYKGRHRFLLHNLKRALRAFKPALGESLSGIDLGGGCGGWIAYLTARAPQIFTQLGLADSAIRGLEDAKSVVGPTVHRYQIDLLKLPWENRWDVVFLLDVLEHIPDHVTVINQIHRALRPGGLLFVTTPALNQFRTYNDDLAHHVRRYSRRDFAALAEAGRFDLCWSRYFMFFLSPLLLLSRLRAPDVEKMTKDEVEAHLRHTHSVPGAPVNTLLELIFSLETPIGSLCPFPWGTSILGVFRKNGAS